MGPGCRSTCKTPGCALSKATKTSCFTTPAIFLERCISIGGGDLQDNVVRDYIAPDKFAELCSKYGITPQTTVVFYGDKSNWWACYALWAFRLFGHTQVKILDGGRDKWKAERPPHDPG